MQFPEFTALAPLSKLELEALRSLYVAGSELRHEYESALAVTGRLYRAGDIAETYTGGQAFTHHPEALLKLGHLAGEYERGVGLLAWGYVSAATVLGTTLLDRLVRGHRPLTAADVTRLCEEPTLGQLRAALSIPLTDLFVAREPEARRRRDADRTQLLDRLGGVFYNAARLDDDKEPDEVAVAACRLSEVSPPDMDPLYEGLLEPLFPYAEQFPFEISWYLRQHRSPIAS